MDQNEVLKMAKKAGGKGLHLCTDPTETTIAMRLDFEQLEAFAKLVAAKERDEWAKEFAGLGEWTAVHILEARGEA